MKMSNMESLSPTSAASEWRVKKLKEDEELSEVRPTRCSLEGEALGPRTVTANIWDWNERASCDSEIESLIDNDPYLREQIRLAKAEEQGDAQNSGIMRKSSPSLDQEVVKQIAAIDTNGSHQANDELSEEHARLSSQGEALGPRTVSANIWDWNERASCDSEIESLIDNDPYLREQIRLAKAEEQGDAQNSGIMRKSSPSLDQEVVKQIAAIDTNGSHQANDELSEEHARLSSQGEALGPRTVSANIWDWNERASCDSEIESLIDNDPYLREQIRLAKAEKQGDAQTSGIMRKSSPSLDPEIVKQIAALDMNECVLPPCVRLTMDSITDSSSSTKVDIEALQRNAAVLNDRLVSLFENELRVVAGDLLVNYADTRGPYERDLNIVVCGAMGAGKSELLGAVTHQFSVLPSSAAEQSCTLVPTNLKRADGDTETFTVRVSYGVGKWAAAREEDVLTRWNPEAAAPALSDNEAEGDVVTMDGEAPRVEFDAADIKTRATKSVLMSVYPIFNVELFDIFEAFAKHPDDEVRDSCILDAISPQIDRVPPTDKTWSTDTTLRVANAFIGSFLAGKADAKDAVEVPGINRLKKSDVQEIEFVGLEKEDVNFLLGLLTVNHTTPLQAIRCLLARFFLRYPRREIQAFDKDTLKTDPIFGPLFDLADVAIKSLCKTPQSQTKAWVSLLSYLKLASKVAERIADQASPPNLDEVYPRDVLNLWPLIDSVSVVGPFKLPLGVVLLDSPGSQDMDNPKTLSASLNGGSSDRIWYVATADRIANNTIYSELPEIESLYNNLVGFRYVFTKVDLRDQDFTVEERFKRILDNTITALRIPREKSFESDDSRTVTAETLVDNGFAVFEVSSLAFMALDSKDGIKYRGKIPDDTLDIFNPDATGIPRLRDDLNDLAITAAEKAVKHTQQHAESLLQILDLIAGMPSFVAQQEIVDYLEWSETTANFVNHLDQPQTDIASLRDGLRLVLASVWDSCDIKAEIEKVMAPFAQASLLPHDFDSSYTAELNKELLSDSNQGEQRVGKHLKWITHSNQLKALANRLGDLVLYRRNPNEEKRLGLSRVFADVFMTQARACLDRHLDHLVNKLVICVDSARQNLIKQTKMILETARTAVERHVDASGSQEKLIRIKCMEQLVKGEGFSSLNIREELQAKSHMSVKELVRGLSHGGIADFRTQYLKLWKDAAVAPKGKRLDEQLELVAEIMSKGMPGIMRQILLEKLAEHHQELQTICVRNFNSAMAKGVQELQNILSEAWTPLDSTTFQEVKRVLTQIISGDANAINLETRPSAAETDLASCAPGGGDDPAEKKMRMSPASSQQSGTAAASVLPSSSSNPPTDTHIVSASTGEQFVLMFRGLCAATGRASDASQPMATRSKAKAQAATSSSSSSPLAGVAAPRNSLGPRQPQHAFIDDLQTVLNDSRYYNMSAFTVIEAKLRGFSNNMPAELEKLGEEIRNDMRLAATRTFDDLAKTLPSKHAQKAVEKAPKSVALHPTKNVLKNLRFSAQQLYSNSDQEHMNAYDEVAKIIRKGEDESDLTVHRVAKVDRERAMKLAASNLRRIEYLRMEVWDWMGKQKYLLPRRLDSALLHGNPYLSLTFDLNHALRYSVGLKKYMQGVIQCEAIPLPYGLVGGGAAAQSNPLQLPPSAVKSLIGVIVMFLVPLKYYKDAVANSVCNPVMYQHGNDDIRVNSRILTENEVTFYGYLPSRYVTKAWQIPMLDLEPSPQKFGEWEKFFNIASPEEPEFKALCVAVRSYTRNRTSKLLMDVRKAYQGCILKRIRADVAKLDEEYPGLMKLLSA